MESDCLLAVMFNVASSALSVKCQSFNFGDHMVMPFLRIFSCSIPYQVSAISIELGVHQNLHELICIFGTILPILGTHQFLVSISYITKSQIKKWRGIKEKVSTWNITDTTWYINTLLIYCENPIYNSNFVI